MLPFIILLIVLILGFVSTNVVFNRLQYKYYIPSGIEYIFLGIVLSPAFSNWVNTLFDINMPLLITDYMILQLSPGVTAAIGIMGLAYGLKFKITDLQKTLPEHLRIVFSEIIISIIIIGGAAFASFYYFFYDGKNLLDIISASYVLAVAGALSSSGTINSIINRFKSDGKITNALKASANFNMGFNIILFGLVFGFIHIGSSENVSITPTEWVVIGIVLAVVIGFLFFIFLGREENEHKFFVAVIGIALFTSGVAYYINFSPLYMNFILGIVLANVSKTSAKLDESLDRLIRPLSILVLVVAGISWYPPNYTYFAVAAAAFIILRYITKSFAGFMAFKTAYDKEKLEPNLGRGLLLFDIVAAAFVIDYMSVYKNDLSDIVGSAVLAGLIFYSFFSFIKTKNYLIDCGEISGEKL